MDRLLKWLQRYKTEGEAGLYEHSCRPQHSSGKSSPMVEEVVLRVRENHPSRGGRKIRRKLAQEKLPYLPSASTITTILNRHEKIQPEEGANQSTNKPP